MDEDKLKAIVEKVVSNAIEPITKQLNDPDIGLKRINEKLDANTESVITIEQTIQVYGDMYKMNNDNAKKLERRIERLEEESGVVPPPELTLAEVI